MIIVKLMGGLGNQMFQYAAARSLSLRHGTELKLDLTFLAGDQAGNTPRTFELGHFNISAANASPQEIALLNGKESTARKTFLSRFYPKGCRYGWYREKQFNVNPEFFLLPDNVHLEGYWQSERYFESMSETIRKDFTLKYSPAGLNLELAEEIRSVNSVSMHVRRGDYVSDEKTRMMHDVCDLEYYCRAEEKITQSVDEPQFYVFSDDPEWVAANLKLHHPARFVRHNQGMAHEDLRLMSLCRHHVIANSSFSWWGAWLAGQSDRLVIAPQRWFNDSSMQVCDLVPARWYKI